MSILDSIVIIPASQYSFLPRRTVSISSLAARFPMHGKYGWKKEELDSLLVQGSWKVMNFLEVGLDEPYCILEPHSRYDVGKILANYDVVICDPHQWSELRGKTTEEILTQRNW